MKKPEFMVHHQWEANGVAIWDNRSTQHYAAADYWPHNKVNQRVTFDERGVKSESVSINKKIVEAGKRR